MSLTRRGFLTKIATVAAALGAVSVARPAAAEADTMLTAEQASLWHAPYPVYSSSALGDENRLIGTMSGWTGLPAAVAEAASAGATCFDCERLFRQVPLPAAPPSPQYTDMARRATHEMAIREGISHDEAGLQVWWQAFPTHSVEPDPLLAQARAEGYERGHDVASARAESKALMRFTEDDIRVEIRGMTFVGHEG